MKISIVNAHWNNRGDEAALVGLLSILRRNLVIENLLFYLKIEAKLKLLQ